MRFCDDHYARNLVCRTTQFELLVLCWKPGQASTIHDHAGSLNVTRVYSGELTSRAFRRRDGGRGVAEVGGAASGELPRGPVDLIDEQVLAGSGAATVDRGEIHQLANESDEGLVTVHFYAPPLSDIVVYSRTRTADRGAAAALQSGRRLRLSGESLVSGGRPAVVGADQGAQDFDLVEPALGQVVEHRQLPVFERGRLGTHEQLVAIDVAALPERRAHDPSGIA